MKRLSPGRIKRGALKYLVLGVLTNSPKHSYDIIKSIEEVTKGLYTPSPGALYPILRRLVMDGHVSMREEGGNKKIYEITENGLKELDKIRRKKGELISDMYRTSGKGMIMREVFELGIFLYQNSESLGEKEAEEVIRIISECRERVEEFIRTKVGKAVGGEGGGGVKVM